MEVSAISTCPLQVPSLVTVVLGNLISWALKKLIAGMMISQNIICKPQHWHNLSMLLGD